jgi:hypothetical protein
VLAFAYGAGVLATVKPCGFAMLASFLGYLLGDDEGTAAKWRPVLARVGRGFAVGLAVTGGFAGVFVAAGLLVVVGLRALVQAVPWAAAMIGGLLVIVGVAAIAARQLSIRVGVGSGSGRVGSGVAAGGGVRRRLCDGVVVVHAAGGIGVIGPGHGEREPGPYCGGVRCLHRRRSYHSGQHRGGGSG